MTEIILLDKLIPDQDGTLVRFRSFAFLVSVLFTGTALTVAYLIATKYFSSQMNPTYRPNTIPLAIGLVCFALYWSKIYFVPAYKLFKLVNLRLIVRGILVKADGDSVTILNKNLNKSFKISLRITNKNLTFFISDEQFVEIPRFLASFELRA